MSEIISIAHGTAPVTLSEAKLFLGVEDAVTTEDTLITNLIAAAVGIAEGYQNRLLIEGTVTEHIWANEELILSYPVNSVTSFTFTDTDDNDTVIVDGEAVEVRQSNEVAYLETLDDWPSGTMLYLEVVYTTGYTSGNLPGETRAALLLLIKSLYDDRDDGPKKYPTTVTRLLDINRIFKYSNG